MSDARQAFADIVNRVAYGSERIAIVRHGRELVAIVPILDLRQLEMLEASASPTSVPVAPAAHSKASPRLRTAPRS